MILPVFRILAHDYTPPIRAGLILASFGTIINRENAVFDLTIYPLSIVAGREQTDVPGLLAANPPRRAVRMRAQDQLLLWVRLTATGASLPSGQQAEMLSRLAETYFGFSGSVTAGLRALSARLNDFLLDRNRKNAGDGQVLAAVHMAVIHGNMLLVGHAGPAHTFVLGKDQVRHFDDGSGSAGRGLGVSRQSIPRFYQAALAPGELLLFCDQPPAAWKERSLVHAPQLSYDLLRRRLLTEAGPELLAAAVRFEPGKGQVTYWKSQPRAAAADVPLAPAGERPRSEPLATPVEAEAEAEAEAPAELSAAFIELPAVPEMDLPPSPAPGRHLEADFVASPTSAMEEEAPFEEIYDPRREYSETPEPPAAQLLGGAPAAASDPAPEPAPPVDPPPMRQRPGLRTRSELRSRTAMAVPPSSADENLTAGEQAAGAARRQRRPVEGTRPPQAPRPNPFAGPLGAAGRGVRAAWRRGAPMRSRVGEALSPFANLSTGALLGIALLVPLVVVAVATAVYFQAGRSEQYQALFLQAQQVAAQTSQATDPAQQRAGWLRTVELVRAAEQYGGDESSAALHRQAQTALDALEGYTRLPYQPALRPLTGGIQITRMAATLNDVYLLDSSQGRILRMYRTATGYEIDATFTCGPGQAGSVTIQPLIDLAVMPTNNSLRATVMGIDSTGNLVYCSPSKEGFDSRPLALPDAGWGKISGIRLYGERLFVLDPSMNAVYYYDGEGGLFTEKPHLYFDTGIPRMDNVVDLALDQEFLYLLHHDGQMTICEGGSFSLAITRCSDAPYGDPRPGSEPSPLIFPGSNFVQIQTTQPPDPSLFAMDTAGNSIYHLSLRRLNLQRQYLPQIDTDFPPPTTPLTAFAVAPNRRVLVAYNNQIFFAPLP
jgi:hypothetical protein